MNETLKNVLLSVQELFNDFDHVIWKKKYEPINDELQPIFIVGPPRTGSTLLYQLMIRHYRCAYISNIMAALPRYMVRLCGAFPVIATGRGDKLHPGYYGYVPGLLGPNEAGKILRNWFDGPRSENTAEAVGKTVNAISTLTGAPILFKNLTNSIRIDDIRRVFPSSRFIVLRREPLFAAQSILQSRQRLHQDKNQWWSVEVPGFEDVLGESPAFQCLWQVITIDNVVDAALADCPDRVARVSYEDLCERPEAVLGELAAAFGLVEKVGVPPPTSEIRGANRVRLDKDEWDDLERHHADLTRALR
jgi:hypothetical protein